MLLLVREERAGEAKVVAATSCAMDVRVAREEKKDMVAVEV